MNVVDGDSHFMEPLEQLAMLPPASVEKILNANARIFDRI
jgi:hypothetical protein